MRLTRLAETVASATRHKHSHHILTYSSETPKPEGGGIKESATADGRLYHSEQGEAVAQLEAAFKVLKEELHQTSEQEILNETGGTL